MAQKWPILDQKGRLAPDSNKASGKALMGHSTSICMGIHALGSFTSSATPKNGRKLPKAVPFLTKKAKHGRLVPGSTKPNGNALMSHMTSLYMGKHVLGPFCSLATPNNGRKRPEHGPFLTKQGQVWQACF